MFYEEKTTKNFEKKEKPERYWPKLSKKRTGSCEK